MRELDRVIGYDDIKEELYRIVDLITNPVKYKKLGVKKPQGILFAGEPGIGKTLMATCFIKETGLEPFIIRKDRPASNFVDYIRQTFRMASEMGPSVILLDDLDKYANEDCKHRDCEEYITVQSCIDEYKNSNVFVVATCNRLTHLPDSLTRHGRFDRQYYMTFPKNEDAIKIVSYYLKGKMVSDSVDVEEIVRLSGGCSCADYEAVVNEAGLIAGYDNRELILEEDIRKACFKVIWGIGSLPSDYPMESLKRVAVHEAGHAVINEIYRPGDVSLISVECQNPNARGLVLTKTSAYKKDSYTDVEYSLMARLAGKAATEVILGEVDIGSIVDVLKGFEDASFLIGSSAAYYFRYRNEEAKEDNLGELKNAEMARYYFKTKQLLIQNRDFLMALIEELTEKKTLTYKDIAPIREQFNLKRDDAI